MKLFLAVSLLFVSTVSFADLNVPAKLGAKAGAVADKTAAAANQAAVKTNEAAGKVQEKAAESKTAANEQTAASTDSKINVNTASKADLAKLPGIGPKKADAIIAGRPYTKASELTKVKGIKAATIKKIEDKIAF